MSETTETIERTDYKLEGEQLKIFKYPAAVLKKVATEVTEFDDDLKELVKNMLYTMYHAPGIGLAAPQVGISKRLFVMDITYDREEVTRADGSNDFEYSNFAPLVFINPIIKNKQGEVLYEEGCLSLPGLYEEVKRAETVTVDYQDVEGNSHSIDADELLSICIQHENDHLDGIVFIERLSMIKKNLLSKKFLKQQKKKS